MSPKTVRSIFVQFIARLKSPVVLITAFHSSSLYLTLSVGGKKSGQNQDAIHASMVRPQGSSEVESSRLIIILLRVPPPAGSHKEILESLSRMKSISKHLTTESLRRLRRAMDPRSRHSIESLRLTVDATTATGPQQN